MEGKIGIKNFITLQPVTVGQVKGTQIIRDDLGKNPAYRVNA
jgi:hypothetical protein